jgi:hypothetical protein
MKNLNKLVKHLEDHGYRDVVVTYDGMFVTAKVRIVGVDNFARVQVIDWTGERLVEDGTVCDMIKNSFDRRAVDIVSSAKSVEF